MSWKCAWKNPNIHHVFDHGEWRVYPAAAYSFADLKSAYVVAHDCEPANTKHGEPWIWGGELHINCPDCGEVCPSEVEAVWTLLLT